MKIKKGIPLIDQHNKNYLYGKKFGGNYIPETLKKPVEDLTKLFEKLRYEKKFLKQRDYYFKNYVGSPTPFFKLENLTNDLCRWPLGEKMEPASLFCGRKTMEKFNYCKLHVLWAFQPRNAKEDDQITEEDIPKFIEKKIKSA